jgi:hypothetical protein
MAVQILEPVDKVELPQEVTSISKGDGVHKLMAALLINEEE